VSFPHTIFGSDQEVYKTYAPYSPVVAQHKAENERFGGRGARMELPDGRIFRYILAGGTELAANYNNQNGGDANMDTLAVQAAVAVGDTSLNVTNATTFLDPDEMRGGYAVVESAAALGQIFRIKSNTASSAGQTTSVITFEDGVSNITALTTSHKVTLTYPLGHEAVVVPTTTPTQLVIGVTPVVIATLNYGWCQSRGIASVFIVGSLTIGEPVIPAGTTPGGVAPSVSETTNIATEVGRLVEIAPTTDFGLVFLTLE
jgi:hypothetical protein